MVLNLSTMTYLRDHITRLETGLGTRSSDASARDRTMLGHAAVDAALQGGIALGAVHEVFSDGGWHNAAATGFVAAFAQRVTARRRALLWIRQDVVAGECGDLAMTGFAEMGLDPASLIVVRTHDAETTLRIAADCLACNGLGAVVAEIWGQPKAFDLVASRKLTLAARRSGVTALLLRLAATPVVSAAETRWLVRAAHSHPGPPWQPWGQPLFDAQLVRNRHGPLGRWIMEWTCDECLFSEPSAHSQPLASASHDRSSQAAHAPHPGRPSRLRSG